MRSKLEAQMEKDIKQIIEQIYAKSLISATQMSEVCDKATTTILESYGKSSEPLQKNNQMAQITITMNYNNEQVYIYFERQIKEIEDKLALHQNTIAELKAAHEATIKEMNKNHKENMEENQI